MGGRQSDATQHYGTREVTYRFGVGMARPRRLVDYQEELLSLGLVAPIAVFSKLTGIKKPVLFVRSAEAELTNKTGTLAFEQV